MKYLLLSLALLVSTALATTVESVEVPHSCETCDHTSDRAFGQKCAVDNLPLSWTGETQMINGRIWKVYRCFNGHTSLGQ